MHEIEEKRERGSSSIPNRISTNYYYNSIYKSPELLKPPTKKIV